MEIYNIDCIDGMKLYPDKLFDLAIVDPPYNLSINRNSFVSTGKYNKKQETRNNSFKIGGNYNDSLGCQPRKQYFDELFRVSKNQIIWGGNYFTDFLPPSSCWIFWNKRNGESKFGDGELAWTSFDTSIRMFTEATVKTKRIHPTEKPVKLYKWLLSKYAKPGYKILDTHLGSGTILQACRDLDFDITAFELDEFYYLSALKRFNIINSQMLITFLK